MSGNAFAAVWVSNLPLAPGARFKVRSLGPNGFEDAMTSRMAEVPAEQIVALGQRKLKRLLRDVADTIITDLILHDWAGVFIDGKPVPFEPEAVMAAIKADGILRTAILCASMRVDYPDLPGHVAAGLA